MSPPTPDLRGKSLLLFDDGLASIDGHWFEYDRQVVQFHTERGAAVTVVCHADFANVAEIEAAGARVLPDIRRSLWRGWGAGGGLIHEVATTVRLARHFAAVLKPLLRDRARDCVFHPSAMAADMLAWCLVPRRLRRRAGRIALLLRFGLGDYGEQGRPRFARKLRAWRWMMRRLEADLASGRIVLLTDSSRLADEYAAVAGVRPTVIGHPSFVGRSRPEPRRGPLTFGTLGAARIDKGVDLFQEAIEAIVDGGTADGLRFVVQWNRPVPTPDGGLYPRSRRLERRSDVVFLDNALSSADYERWFGEVDCMVLPYRRALYHSQISGVAIEAACAGIPMIYTADTWLSDFVAEQGAGIAIADGDAAGLARAIHAMKADYAAYKQAAVERGAVSRERNSPDSFLRTLWGASR